MTARALPISQGVLGGPLLASLVASIIQPVSLVCSISISVHRALRFRRWTLSKARSSVIVQHSAY